MPSSGVSFGRKDIPQSGAMMRGCCAALLIVPDPYVSNPDQCVCAVGWEHPTQFGLHGIW